MEKSGELLTVKEVMGILKVSEATVWRMLRQGELPIVKVAKRGTRIKRNDLDAYIEAHYRPARYQGEVGSPEGQRQEGTRQ